MASWVSMLVERSTTVLGGAPRNVGHAMLAIHEDHPDGWSKYEVFHAVPRRPRRPPAVARTAHLDPDDQDEGVKTIFGVPSRAPRGPGRNPFAALLNPDAARAAMDRARFGPLAGAAHRAQETRRLAAEARARAEAAGRRAAREAAAEADRRDFLAAAGLGPDDPQPTGLAAKRAALDPTRDYLSVERYRYCAYENTVWSVGGMSRHDIDAYALLKGPDWYGERLSPPREIVETARLVVPDHVAAGLTGLCFDASRAVQRGAFSVIGANVRYGGNCVSWVYDVLRSVGVYADWAMYGWSFVSPRLASERGGFWYDDPLARPVDVPHAETDATADDPFARHPFARDPLDP